MSLPYSCFFKNSGFYRTFDVITGLEVRNEIFLYRITLKNLLIHTQWKSLKAPGGRIPKFENYG